MAAARVRVMTGHTAPTTAVTSAVRCVWTCALVCVRDNAATSSVLAASTWPQPVSPFSPANRLKHQIHTVSHKAANIPTDFC